VLWYEEIQQTVDMANTHNEEAVNCKSSLVHISTSFYWSLMSVSSVGFTRDCCCWSMPLNAKAHDIKKYLFKKIFVNLVNVYRHLLLITR